MVAYHFPPIGGPASPRALGFARFLPEHGYDVAVVTGPGDSSGLWTPEDRSLLDLVPSTTEVHRVNGPQPTASRPLGRVGDRLLGRSPPDVRSWIREAVDLGLRIGRDADVIIGELAPYESALVAERLARTLGKPWVADLHDPWALDEMWLYPTGVHRRLDRRRMRRLLGSAAAVITTANEASRRLVVAFPELAAHPPVAVPIGFDAQDFEGPTRAARPDPLPDRPYGIHAPPACKSHTTASPRSATSRGNARAACELPHTFPLPSGRRDPAPDRARSFACRRRRAPSRGRADRRRPAGSSRAQFRERARLRRSRPVDCAPAVRRLALPADARPARRTSCRPRSREVL